MNFRFDSYSVTDDGILFVFSRVDAGREGTGYTCFVTDAELAAISTPAQLRTLIVGKLQRKLQASGIASKLDSFIGATVTI